MDSSLKAMSRANVVALVIDSAEGLGDVSVSENTPKRDIPELASVLTEKMLTADDLSIISRAAGDGKAVMLVANKWDLVPRHQRELALTALRDRMASTIPDVANMPVVAVSARHAKNIDAVLPTAVTLYERWNRTVATSTLNKWLAELQRFQPPPQIGGRRIALRFMSQISTRPPTFVLPLSRKRDIPTSYVAFITRKLREEFDLWGVPVRLRLRQTVNPFDLGKTDPKVREKQRTVNRRRDPTEPASKKQRLRWIKDRQFREEKMARGVEPLEF